MVLADELMNEATSAANAACATGMPSAILAKGLREPRVRSALTEGIASLKGESLRRARPQQA